VPLVDRVARDGGASTAGSDGREARRFWAEAAIRRTVGGFVTDGNLLR
jgi:hypothetical protein